MADVRHWLAEYLEKHAAEAARFPAELGKSHWDLLAADYNSSEEAQFIAALFSGDEVTVLAGLGSIADVREFAERSFPEDSAEILDELSKRFRTGERRTIALSEIIEWVQR